MFSIENYPSSSVCPLRSQIICPETAQGFSVTILIFTGTLWTSVCCDACSARDHQPHIRAVVLRCRWRIFTFCFVPILVSVFFFYIYISCRSRICSHACKNPDVKTNAFVKQQMFYYFPLAFRWLKNIFVGDWKHPAGRAFRTAAVP